MIAHARRWLELDPLNEAAHREVIPTTLFSDVAGAREPEVWKLVEW